MLNIKFIWIGDFCLSYVVEKYWTLEQKQYQEKYYQALAQFKSEMRNKFSN